MTAGVHGIQRRKDVCLKRIQYRRKYQRGSNWQHHSDLAVCCIQNYFRGQTAGIPKFSKATQRFYFILNMATTIEVADGNAFHEAIASVRSDATEDTYVLCGHVNGDPNRIQVLKVGQDTSELATLLDDSQVMYALGRYETKFDMSTTVKFVYFRWIGDKVPVAKKGRYGVVRGEAEALFSPYHLFVESSNAEDFNNDRILQQLEETSGTKSKVLDSTEGRQMRGFTQTQLPTRDNRAKFGVSNVAKEGAAVGVEDEVLAQVAAVCNDANPVSWLVAGYKDNNPKGPIVVVGSGEGGLGEVTSLLDPAVPMYAFYRVTDKVDDITTVKFVYIVWIGESTKPMTRAKISTHKGVAEQTFTPAHITIFASDLSDLSENIIMQKVRSASGSQSHVK
ncbi:uncharacterized protein LOC112576354 isoform X2 [Pomacea canaliculata]|uniref:uncharacterized protein LOC112576354 isoform X2 n=1 Tax=Pomacea canaliculata TaxID=400727 RepID=UPI000D73C86C|nr:uncharacterized protein LOC112576354 isoform X2 [Pomacea canaliculata]